MGNYLAVLWAEMGTLDVARAGPEWGSAVHPQETLLADGLLARGQGRTLVFAGNVAAAKEVAAVLREAGLQPLLYHKEVSPEDRASALATMRSRHALATWSIGLSRPS